MRNFKNFITVFSFFLFGFQAFAQPGQQYAPEDEMILYVKENLPTGALEAAVNLLNGTLVVSPDPNQNIALMQWNGPFTINGVYISSVVEIANFIASDNTQPPGQQSLPEIDGGVFNHSIGVPSVPNSSSFPPFASACYPSPYIGSTTSNEVTLAIFDTGVEHVLAQQNGYVFGDVKQLNLDITDNNGHGTHVATIIDKTFHNAVKGNELKYIVSNTFNANGEIDLSTLLFDLEDALRNNTMEVVNLSFSYPGYSSGVDPLERLIKHASDVLFVVAAGNDSQSLDGNQTYFPAAFNADNILTVGSYACLSRGGLTIAPFSNYSNTYVDLLAPGIDISGMNNVGQLVEMSGTSQSTGIVSGVAAAIATKMAVFNPEEVKCIILSNVEIFTNLSSFTLSSGILDIETALEKMTCDGDPGEKKIIEKDNFAVEMFPNPFSNELNITIELNKDDNLQLEMFDMSGKQLQVITGEGYEGVNEYSITFDEIAFQNQYILRIKTSDSVVTKRVIRIE